MQVRFEHPTEDTLELYSLGMLAEEQAEILEEHVFVCVDCQERLAETDAYVLHMRAAAAKLRACTAGEQTGSAGPISFTAVLPKLGWVAIALLGLLVMAWVFAGRTHLTTGSPAPVAVTLQANRGEPASLASRAPRGRALLLQADVTGLSPQGPCELEIVDAAGHPAQRRSVKAEEDHLTATVAGLGSGAYWVRLYACGSPDEMLREYALHVE